MFGPHCEDEAIFERHNTIFKIFRMAFVNYLLTVQPM